jgi:uncharacterized membrane protein YjgN (DUF898 family)
VYVKIFKWKNIDNKIIKMKKQKKGVSPIIASILLVVLVLIIALIIFLWLRSLTQEAVVKFDKNVELVCNDVAFNAEYSNSKLQLTNNGNVPIFDFNIKEFSSVTKNTETKNISSSYKITTWPSYGLQAGKSGSYSISFNSISKITVIPVLRGRTESGEKNFVCDENQYGKEIVI